MKIQSPVSSPKIRNDSEGSGGFGSARGARYHRGLDLLALEGQLVFAPQGGIINRIGTCYSDTKEFKLIEILTWDVTHRLLYVDPEVSLIIGDRVRWGQFVGYAQNISKRYGPKMKNHIHWEVKINEALVGKGRYPKDSVWIDPLILLGRGVVK